MRETLVTATKDVDGAVRAFIVQPRVKIRRRTSKRVQRILRHDRGIRGIAVAVLRGLYIMSIVWAMLTAASLLEFGTPDDIGRLVAAVIWIAVPVAAWCAKKAKRSR